MTESQKTAHEQEKPADEAAESRHGHSPEGRSKTVSFGLDIGLFLRHWHIFALAAIFVLSFFARTYYFHYPYLLNVDSYFQYRYIGYVADGGIPERDMLMLAPVGLETGLSTGVSNIYHYIGGYSYLLAKIFFPGLELWQYLVYLPAILAGLMVIPAYYIGRVIYDRKAGVLMAFLTLFNPAIFMRSLGGDPDTDAIVMLMPMLVMMFFLLAYDYMQKDRKILNYRALIFSGLTGVFLAAYAFTWVGYWYILFLIGGFMVSIILIDTFRHRGKDGALAALKKSRHIMVNLAIMIFIFCLLTVPVFGIGFIERTVFQPFAATNLKAETGDFPNVFVSVQEMMAGGSLSEIVQRAGPVFFFLTYIVCIPYLIGTYFYKRKHMETMVLIALWSIGSLFATIFAVRFSILLAIPLSLGSAIILAKLWRLAVGQDKGVFE